MKFRHDKSRRIFLCNDIYPKSYGRMIGRCIPKQATLACGCGWVEGVGLNRKVSPSGCFCFLLFTAPNSSAYGWDSVIDPTQKRRQYNTLSITYAISSAVIKPLVVMCSMNSVFLLRNNDSIVLAMIAVPSGGLWRWKIVLFTVITPDETVRSFCYGLQSFRFDMIIYIDQRASVRTVTEIFIIVFFPFLSIIYHPQRQIARYESSAQR